MTERFEQVATEFGHGSINGSIYGAQVRVLLRAPDAVLFVALGLQLWSPRIERGWPSMSTLVRTVNIANLSNEKVQARIEEKFGEGSAAWALKAWRTRGMGTVLVDGGGDPLPLPAAQQRARAEKRHAEVSPDWQADLTGQIKTCLHCGANLTPVVSWHRFGFDANERRPKTRDDCQRMTNQQVVSVRGYDMRYPDREHEIESFTTWDGETVEDPYFCHGGRCAAAYGRRFAALVTAGTVPALPADGSEPPKHDISGVREDKDHYEKVPRYIEHNGKSIRIE